MSIAAGEFNRKIALCAPGTGKDALNQPIKSWVPYATPWAKIMGATGMAAVRSAEDGVPIAAGRYSFRIRYRPVGVLTSHSVLFNGMYFDIADVRHDLAGQEYTDIVCELGASNG